MTIYFVTTGLYLSNEYALDKTGRPLEEIEQDAYYASLEIAESYEGLHGFCMEEEYEDMDEEDARREARHEEIENALDYAVEVYNPDEHDGCLS